MIFEDRSANELHFMIKLAAFFLTIYVMAFLGFWMLGMVYGSLLRRPAVYFPARLAATMAAAGLAGSLLLGIGGVVLPTVVMERAFARRSDHRALTVVVAGSLMSLLVVGGTFLFTYWLAWAVFE